MANWGDIPIDVAQEIVAHLDFHEDCETFIHVCSAWRSAFKQISLSRRRDDSNIRRCQPPLLMLADPPQTPYRRFYSLLTCMVRKVDLPLRVLNNHNNENRRYFSSRGWLISLSQSSNSDQNTLKITVFNPFSGKVIEPPCISADLLHSLYPEEWEVGDHVYLIGSHKFILSSSTSQQDDDLVALAVIFEKNHRIGFWSLGQDRWVIPTKCNKKFYHDVCFHRGKFYAINDLTEVIAFTPVTNLDNNRIINWCPKKVENLAIRRLMSLEYFYIKCYLVGEWEQDLILVLYREVILNEDNSYFTALFRVIEVNVETGVASVVTSLGDRTIFVGFNSTFFVVAPTSGDERACKPNCIYFADDSIDYYGGKNTRYGGGSDMGIYSLVERKVLEEQVYQGPFASRYCFVTPPIWVEDSQKFPFTLDC